MAKTTLAEQFQIRPVPKKRKDGRQISSSRSPGAAFDAYRCENGMICVYVVGPDDSRLSKVGISIYPYGRMAALTSDAQMTLKMCYFAEMTTQQGRLVEREFLRQCTNTDARVDGEWVSVPRDQITTQLREIMARHGIVPRNEVGDTGDSRGSDAAGCPRAYVGGEFFSLGISPTRKKNG